VRELVNMMAKPYDDPEKIRELYHGRGMSQTEVADELGCSKPTIRKRMKKFGIEIRDVGGSDPNADHRDSEILQELYVEKGMTTYEVADELDTGESTIRYWMDKYGFDRRTKWKHTRSGPAYYHTDNSGYEEWQVKACGDRHSFRVHRLAAIAWYGFDAVSDMQVHHQNGIKWDTREENVTLMSLKDHARHHANKTEFWKYRDDIKTQGNMEEQ